MYDIPFQKAISLLREYITIDTTIPPGNVEGAISFLNKIFQKEGIPTKIYEASPHKKNLMAVVKGSGEKPPILLLNHMDVVPANPKSWSVNPFGGVIKDGYLYGRGTLDMKGIAILQALAMIEVAKEKTPHRNIYFLATCDEEVGGFHGAKWMVENVSELTQVEAVINEGWPLVEEADGSLKTIKIDNAEKLALHIKMYAKGTTGHASIPLQDNPNLRIIKTLYEIANIKDNYRVLPYVAEYFKAISHTSPPHLREKYKDVEKALKDEKFISFLEENPSIKALLSDTISITILKGGNKINVIPTESEASIDVRLLPDADPEQFVKRIEKICDKFGVKVKLALKSKKAPPSSTDTDIYKAIKNLYKKHFPNAHITPCMLTATTDSRFFRSKNINAYGFAPYRLSQEEFKRIHGIDERISLENIKMGLSLMTQLLQEIS